MTASIKEEKEFRVNYTYNQSHYSGWFAGRYGHGHIEKRVFKIF